MAHHGATTTAEEVLHGIGLGGKTIVVTGGSSGLGAETVRVLARAGATVLMAVRDPGKAAAVIAAIRADHPAAIVEAVRIDLADLRSVRACAAEVLARFPRIDVLVNNAGVAALPLGYTDQGCELQFGINHIGHFLLTCLLLPALKRSPAARIVVLSSAAHRFSDLDAADPHYRHRPYEKWQAYGQSKTANVLFAAGLARRLGPCRITVNALHPGAIATELDRALPREERAALRSRYPNTVWKSAAQGAATTVWAAASPELAGVSGKYLENCQVAPLAVHAGAPGYFAYAVDPDAAERLWDLSERIVGQCFGDL